MFHALNIYRIVAPITHSITWMEDAISKFTFVPCAHTQDKSVGWVPPRGEKNGALVESVNGQRILKLMIETKSVPATAIKKKVEEEAARIEQNTGRKPGKKETKELKEDAYTALLPAAFPRQTAVLVWIDQDKGLLMTDASSQGRNDEAITALVRALDGLQIALVQTEISAGSIMSSWLLDGDKLSSHDRFDFDIERSCELRSEDEEKSVVRFKNHNLDTDEVRKHITEGKHPVKLALSYKGRIGFELDLGMRLNKIKYLEGIFADGGTQDDKEGGFDADVALATSELAPMILDLIDALGGELTNPAK